MMNNKRIELPISGLKKLYIAQRVDCSDICFPGTVYIEDHYRWWFIVVKCLTSPFVNGFHVSGRYVKDNKIKVYERKRNGVNKR